MAIIYKIEINNDGSSSRSSSFDIRWFRDIGDDFEIEIRQIFNEKTNESGSKASILEIVIRDDGTSKYSSDFNLGWFSTIIDDFYAKIKHIFNEKINERKNKK